MIDLGSAPFKGMKQEGPTTGDPRLHCVEAVRLRPPHSRCEGMDQRQVG